MPEIPAELYERDAQDQERRPQNCLQSKYDPGRERGRQWPCVYPYCWCNVPEESA